MRIEQAAPLTASKKREASPYLLSALQRTRLHKYMDVKDVFEAIQAGQTDLWFIVKDGIRIGAMTTQVVEFPKRKELALILVGVRKNERSSWIDELRELLVALAKKLEVQGIRGGGRKGWLRRLGVQLHSTNQWVIEV